jgi:bifunctional non-homologous end joining protein LigD
MPIISWTVPTGPQWTYEIKHDGFRLICWRADDQVRVFSRQDKDCTDRVPLIAEALQALRVKSVTIDGEGVVCRRDGVSDFDRLRASVGRLGSRDAFLYAFDLPEKNRRRRPAALRVERAARDVEVAAKARPPGHPPLRTSRRRWRARIPARML